MFDRQSNTRTQGNNSNSDWKASAFVNIFVTRKNGTRCKLGFIALKAQDPEHAQLIEWLEADPANLEKLQSKLVLDYRVVEEKTDDGLDL